MPDPETQILHTLSSMWELKFLKQAKEMFVSISIAANIVL